MKVLMCSPQYYDIFYEINPWMDVRCKAQPQRAMLQWENLCRTLEQVGIEIHLIEPVPHLPDLTFTANAGLVIENSVYLSHFLFPERQKEEPYFRQWFTQSDYRILEFDGNYYFEGEGDALWAGNRLFAGYNIRTQKPAYEKIRLSLPTQQSLVFCELVDPYFYHLDTCFCPLNAEQAIWWPAAFSGESQDRMNKVIDLWAVPELEAHAFACNSVVVGQDIVLPAQCHKTELYLQSLGFTTHVCEVDEFLKAGGACKCLTLII